MARKLKEEEKQAFDKVLEGESDVSDPFRVELNRKRDAVLSLSTELSEWFGKELPPGFHF